MQSVSLSYGSAAGLPVQYSVLHPVPSTHINLTQSSLVNSLTALPYGTRCCILSQNWPCSVNSRNSPLYPNSFYSVLGALHRSSWFSLAFP